VHGVPVRRGKIVGAADRTKASCLSARAGDGRSDRAAAQMPAIHGGPGEGRFTQAASGEGAGGGSVQLDERRSSPPRLDCVSEPCEYVEPFQPSTLLSVHQVTPLLLTAEPAPSFSRDLAALVVPRSSQKFRFGITHP